MAAPPLLRLISSVFSDRTVLRGLHLLQPSSVGGIVGSRHSTKLVYRMASNDSISPSPSSPLTPTQTITLAGGDPVEIVAAPGFSESELRKATESALFKQWLKNMQSEKGLLAHGQMCLRQVHIQGVDMFGRRVGFLKFKADVFDKESGMKIPGIVFARGPAVAILILLESGGETYVVLTEQVEEETGISLNAEDMINLTAFLNTETGCKVFPSPGGCDEELSLFLYKGHVKEEIISALHGKDTGLREHGELIKVHVVPYNELWRMTADAKALTAIALYEMAKRDGLLP